LPTSAGILLYRRRDDALEVLLAHPGGPFWRGRDEGAWMIPKGAALPDEEPVACALREFEEELGARPAGTPRPLCRIRQKGGKWVVAFALEGDFDPRGLVSNPFNLESKDGRILSFPEVDQARWFGLDEARARILPSQRPILDALKADLDG
jgi:predicted NUDIX family NTP pyrophosphohydrolase